MQDGTDDLLKYVCSRRVIPLMTSRMNAVRCARLVRHPVVGSIGQMLWSFNSASQGYMQPAPWFEVLLHPVPICIFYHPCKKGGSFVDMLQ